MTSTTTAPAFTLQPEQLETAIPSDAHFYAHYDWAIDAAPPLRHLSSRLARELERYLDAPADWRRGEGANNIFLLACAIADTVDDVILGSKYDFSKITGVFSFLSPATNAAQKLLAAVDDARHWRSRHTLVSWRRKWESTLNTVLKQTLLRASAPTADFASTIESATSLLAALPLDVQHCRPRIPAAFRSQDLSHFDVLKLGDKFVAEHPDRETPLLIIGLRTAGSYFAPLLRAHLENEGYLQVSCVTVRPTRGIAGWEKDRIRNSAQANCTGIVIDEPVGTGKTFAKGVSLLNKAGILSNRIYVLIPVHRHGQHWQVSPEAQALSTTHLLTLSPEEWHKDRFFESSRPQEIISEYFHAQGWSQVSCTDAERFNDEIRAISEEKFHSRLKRVFAVTLASSDETKTRYVIAKSVGWGWLGYHAFIAGLRLQGAVPRVLTLREGTLFSEWVVSEAPLNRAEQIRHIAGYVAARQQSLRFHNPRLRSGKVERQLARGTEELASALSAAYGKAGGILKRARIRRDLVRLEHRNPAVLIDGRMRPMEWIDTADRLLKSDFEHHGMGKHQLNVSDPAYDLADAILHFKLSPDQEDALLKEYIAQSGDRDVMTRLLLYKILAGNWSMDRALENLNDPKMLRRHLEFNTQYLNAWNFLTSQTVRFCGERCWPPSAVTWRSPLAVLDVDGVLDKKIFGYPSATMASMQGISLLHSNNIAVALNSARSINEVKEYSRAYGFCGGVAESGAYVCDLVNGTEKIIVSRESLEQLDRLRDALRSVPGVFLNDDYRHSIKAHMFERGTTVGLPKILVDEVIASLRLDRLSVTRTFLDTTIVARETDKGKGLRALLELAGMERAVTFAVGDSAPDLAMFREASFSFAPGHISCGGAARLFGCHVASAAYQPGFLECARTIVSRCGGDPSRTPQLRNGCSPQENYFLKLLTVADRLPVISAALAVLDPMVLDTFLAD